jgi:hypothetical protein
MTHTNQTALDLDKLEALLGRYWEIAYSEGKTGESRGDEAQEVLSSIRQLARRAQPSKPVAWIATDLDGRADVGLTKEEAKRRAGEGCTEFIPLYDVGSDSAAGAGSEQPSTTNPMCERKTNHIMERDGYHKTGYVLMVDDPAARICVSDQGAVSWFTRDQWNWLMHNRDHVEFQWPKPIGAAPSSSASEQDERAGFEAHIHTMDVPSDALDRWPDGRYLQDAIEGCWSGWQARAAHQAATNPFDPMDWPIPCDVKVGGCTIRKGCKLSTLVTRMESLHRMAMKAIPKPTPEARAMVDAMIAGTWDGTEPPTQAAPEAPASAQPVAAAPTARQIMFAAYSRCIVDDRLSPDQIADVLLSAAPAAPVAQATTASTSIGDDLEFLRLLDACLHAESFGGPKASENAARNLTRYIDSRAPAPSREAAPKIATWRERMDGATFRVEAKTATDYTKIYIGDRAPLEARDVEIADLRAALAQQGASQDAAANAGELSGDLIEAGALRQYRHNNDVSPVGDFVFAYDKDVTDNFIAHIVSQRVRAALKEAAETDRAAAQGPADQVAAQQNGESDG